MLKDEKILLPNPKSSSCWRVTTVMPTSPGQGGRGPFVRRTLTRWGRAAFALHPAARHWLRRRFDTY